MLKDKKIILGVCGSIAAYKSAHLVRLFVKDGASVQVLMTQSAQQFVTPLTFATLSKRPVYSEIFSSENLSAHWTNHVELGKWADVMLVAPASANTIAKLVNGVCDDMLSAVYLSARCPVIIAPAMDLDMYKHPSVQKNLQTLAERGNKIMDAEYGELASGLIGEGRMAEPEHIEQFLENYFRDRNLLKGKKVLVTAGPTYEAIDPVRFLGNHSSGKMGFALARACADFGADVTLISGPGKEEIRNSSVKRVNVVSAKEMFDAVKKESRKMDMIFMAAAVSDYTPEKYYQQKLKDYSLTLNLKLTADILAYLGKHKTPKQKLIGFALETENERKNAREKLKAKNADFIVLNSLKDEGAGFGTDTNRVTILSRKKEDKTFPLQSKTELAREIVKYVS